jgi:ribonuclease P protein component
MLKKKYRLFSDFHFNVTKKYGKRYNYPLFTIYSCNPLNYSGPCKIGINTPVSFNKAATKRNRAKRIISELIRLNFEKFPVNKWIVIYPRPDILNKTHEEIITEFNKTLSEISIA